MSFSPDRSALGRSLAKLGHWIRAAWLAAGIGLLGLVLLELLARRIGGVGRGDASGERSRRAASHPYAAADWWPELQRDLAARRSRPDPYRGEWSRPLRTRYLNIDSVGRRLTPQPALTSSKPGRVVLLLGDGALWGGAARDSATIASQLAALFGASGNADLTVVNLAQPRFTLTQQAVTLLLEVSQGPVPAAAVFLGGYGDVAAAAVHHEPGHASGEKEIERRIALGRRGTNAELLGLARHFVLFGRRGHQAEESADPGAVSGSPSSCRSLAAHYLRLVLAIEALGRSRGMPVLFFLEPNLATSAKPRTVWEAALQPRPLVAPCFASVDSALRDRPGGGATFTSLGEIFDRDTATVFVTPEGDLTESANRRVAARIAELLGPLLESRAVGSGGRAP